MLKESKREEDLALDEEELRLWLKAFDDDLNQRLIEFKDYVLFYTTLALTHSDQSITKTYINTKNTVKQSVGETAFRIIKKS